METERQVLGQFLRAYPSAVRLDPDDLDRLLQSAGTSFLPAGEALFRQGEEPDALYFVVEGSVRIERTDEAGRTVVLDRLGRGAMVGEMGVIRRRARMASAVVEEDLVALRLDAENWEAFRQRAHPVAGWLLEEVDRRLADRVVAALDRLGRLREEPQLAREPAPVADPPRRSRWRRLWKRWRA